MKQIIVVIFILGTIFSSCRKLVQDEFPVFDKEITVNSIISADDSVKLHLSYTAELNQTPLETIGDADITMINQNDECIYFTYQGNGVYSSEYIARENDSLTLTVVVSGKDTAKSSCVVPKSIPIMDVKIDSYGWINDEGDASPLAHIKVKNNLTKSIYGVVYARMYVENSWNPNTIQLDNDYKPIGTFDNNNNNNEYIRQSFGIIKTSLSGSNTSQAYQILIRSVDYNYYTYINTLKANEFSKYIDFTNSFIVPTNIYSNIENGYGIMCSYSQSETDTIF